MIDVRRIAIALGWSIEAWQLPGLDGRFYWYSRLLNEHGDCLDDFGPFERPSVALGEVLLRLVNGEYDYREQIDADWPQWGWTA